MKIGRYRVDGEALLGRIVFRWHWKLGLIGMLLLGLYGVLSGVIPPSGVARRPWRCRLTHTRRSWWMANPGRFQYMRDGTVLKRGMQMAVAVGRMLCFNQTRSSWSSCRLAHPRRGCVRCRHPRPVT